MIQSFIQHLIARASALDTEAETVRVWAGETAALGARRAGQVMLETIDSWLDAELDVREASAETGVSERWLRERFPSTGSGANRRWKRRDLLPSRVRYPDEVKDDDHSSPSPDIGVADAADVLAGVAKALQMIA